ncbi:MAG TPA: T9SS type A sorting domain-containing protein [Bacteroidetes bacterium]|nr:T9SS type A sorting domain-containing protein [Bacteroidota bacterium]
METYLTHAEDINNEDPEFVSPDDFDYSLTVSSVGIDAGVDGAPEFDIDGNPRVNRPDIGAYENQDVTGVGEVLLENNGMFAVAPNPVKGSFTIGTLDNEWTGQIEVRLTNLLGQQLKTVRLDKTSDTFKFEFSLEGINTGVYHLAVSNGEQVVVDRLVKL